MEKISDILMAIFANVVYLISALFLLAMLCIAFICVLTNTHSS
jgi:hypothetical protein